VNGTTGAGDNNDDLSGGNGGDTLVGNGGDDSLGGEKGLDTLFGGAGNDEFLFSGGDGNDTIADFGIASGNDDEITFVNTNRDSFEELVITQNGANTEINAGNVKVVLSNFAAANLTEDDFNFS
jgi:Ca2+-binding RTX toxin-like protein